MFDGVWNWYVVISWEERWKRGRKEGKEVGRERR